MRNESDAQEILQKSYLAAWLNLPNFEGRAQFASWMYRVTVNASLMLLRVRNRHPEMAIDNIEPAGIDDVCNNCSQRPDEEVQSAELRHQMIFSVGTRPGRWPRWADTRTRPPGSWEST